MYVGTDKVFGQGVTLGEEPDPAAMRAQQELMERRRKLLEQRKILEKEKEERETHQRNLELLERGEFDKSVLYDASFNACREARLLKEARKDYGSKMPSNRFRLHERMVFLRDY